MTNFTGSISSYGNLSTNVDIQGVSDAKVDEIFRPIIELKTELQNQLEVAKENGDTGAVAELSSQIESLDTKANQIKSDIEGQMKKLGVRYNPNMRGIANSYLSGLDTKVATEIAFFSANEAGATASDQALDVVNGTYEAKPQAGILHNATPALNDGKAWTELASTNPEEFQRQLEGLTANEQQQVNMSMQTNLQQENRMWAMMTAVSQAEHDTQKAIISNFRV